MTEFNFLKCDVVSVRGQRIEIRELTAGAAVMLSESVKQGHTALLGCQVVKFGVPDYSELSVDEIAAKLPLDVVQVLADAIYALSGMPDTDADDETPPEKKD